MALGAAPTLVAPRFRCKINASFANSMSSKKHSKANIGTGSAKSARMIAPVVTSAVTRKAKSPPVVVSMREEIGDLNLVEQFTNTPLLVMPTNETLFPWGFRIAKLYTTRKWRKLVIEYVPNTATTIGGTVMAAMQADPDKPPFTDDQELLNHQNAVNGAPYTGWRMDLLQTSNKTPIPAKFNANQESIGLGLDISEDLHTIADGVLNIAVKGLQSFFGAGVAVTKTQSADGKTAVSDVKSADPPTVVNTGKLYVDYVVEYNDPVMTTVDGGYAEYVQHDDSGRALVTGEQLLTPEAIATPVSNNLGIQVACDDITGDGGPPNHIKRVGLKFATPGLYLVNFGHYAFSDDVQGGGNGVDMSNAFIQAAVGSDVHSITPSGPASSSATAVTYRDETNCFAVINVFTLANESTSIEVGGMDCDVAAEFFTFATGSVWDPYVQGQFKLIIGKSGPAMMAIPAHLKQRKGGLSCRTMPNQLAWFERRQFAKAVQVRSAQRAIDDAVREKRRSEVKEKTRPERVWPPGRSVVGIKFGAAGRPESAGVAAGAVSDVKGLSSAAGVGSGIGIPTNVGVAYVPNTKPVTGLSTDGDEIFEKDAVKLPAMTLPAMVERISAQPTVGFKTTVDPAQQAEAVAKLMEIIKAGGLQLPSVAAKPSGAK